MRLLLGLSSALLMGGALGAQPVEITLAQKTQAKCQGELLSKAKAEAGDCIVYDVKVLNFSTKLVSDVKVAALIPEGTKLVSPFKALKGLDSVETTITGLGKGIGSVTTMIPQLKAGKQNEVRLRYKVKVK